MNQLDVYYLFKRVGFLNRIAPKAIPLKYIHHPELICLNCFLSYNYACKNKKPFPLGEPEIAKSAHLSFLYARDILKDKFELAEPAIAKDAQYSYMYAIEILKEPFPLGEPVIANNVFFRNQYTYHVLKKDFYVDGVLISTFKPEPKNLTISENELNW